MALLEPAYFPVFRAFDSNGNPLVGGLLYTYQAGTSTPLATYTEADRLTANSNPVVLNDQGESRIFLDSAVYKMVLTDATGAEQWTIDNVDATGVQGMTWPPAGIAVSTGSAWGTAIDPLTIAYNNKDNNFSVDQTFATKVTVNGELHAGPAGVLDVFSNQ